MKIAKYLILELLFIILVINSYWFFADMDRDNSVCVDVGNYLEFEWSSYFHWFREDLNQICHFDEKNLFMYFWFVFTYYTLFKIITVRFFPLGCKLRFLIPEMIIFISAFGIRTILEDLLIITDESIKNAIIGLLFMFSPFILYMLFLYTLYRLVLWEEKNIKILKTHPLLVGILLFLVSLFIFPPVATIFYCILWVPFILWVIYIKLPQIFITLCNHKKHSKNKYFIGKLILSLTLALSCITGEVFFFRTFYSELSGFVFFTYYILFSAVIRLVYYGAMIWLWNTPSKNILQKEYS